MFRKKGKIFNSPSRLGQWILSGVELLILCAQISTPVVFALQPYLEEGDPKESIALLSAKVPYEILLSTISRFQQFISTVSVSAKCVCLSGMLR